MSNMNDVRPYPEVPPPFPIPVPKMTESEIDMFWQNIEKRTDGCWVWTGQRTPRPTWGVVWLQDDYPHLAHRVAYYLHTGIDPLDHGISFKCLNPDAPGCCNPDHLELVSPYPLTVSEGE